MLNQYVLSLDVDWAPECAIGFVADILFEKRIKATWFITHDSPMIRKLYQHNDLFEFGIHPNFLPNSTHGSSEREVMEHMARLVPNAKVMRAHALVQSTPLLNMAARDFGIEIDVSLFLPLAPSIQPHKMYFDHVGTGLVRIPFFFEDDLEMYNPSKSWEISHPKYRVSGLKVFNFHPTYIYLNCATMYQYQALKKTAPLYSFNQNTCAPFINKSTSGTKDLFIQLCEYIVEEQKKSYTLSEIALLWKESNAKS